MSLKIHQKGIKYMKIKVFGIYTDEKNNAYEVLELTEIAYSNPLVSHRQEYDSFRRYKTSCGMSLTPKGEKFTTIDGVFLTKEL
jgi:hypothetical protein